MTKERAMDYALSAAKTALENPSCHSLVLDRNTAEGIAEFIKTLTNELSKSDE